MSIPRQYQLHREWGYVGQGPWDAEWLLGRASSVNSQYGEDGLISAIFERIGEENRHCFEFGASDGKLYSNTLALRERGWSALLIESRKFPKLMAMQSETVRCIDGYLVTPNNVNELLGGLPVNCDFGSIDIDGQDYHVWSALNSIRPRVVCIEHNPYRDSYEYVIPSIERLNPPPMESDQATLRPIKELGESKGYDLVAVTYCNCLFVRRNQL